MVDPGQDVNHLGEVDGTDPRLLGRIAEGRFDLGCRGLVEEEGDDGLGVEDGQRVAPRSSSTLASSSRV